MDFQRLYLKLRLSLCYFDFISQRVFGLRQLAGTRSSAVIAHRHPRSDSVIAQADAPGARVG
jgi:hypothetical protein